ncbi:MAG: hypothetical protein ACI86X_000671 [Moritella sp.]|jgi:hypothetical protein
MRKVTLSPDQAQRFGVGGNKYLIVREAQEYIYISNDQGEQIRVDAGDKLNVSEFNNITLSNPHTVNITVVYQLTKQDLTTTPPALVKFGESIAVSEIRSPVNTITPTAQRFISRDHVFIEPNQKVKLFNTSVVRLEAIIQNISQTEAEIMLGDNKVSAVVGLPILGDRKAPAGMTITGGGELWAYNNSNVQARVALLEVHR